MSDPSRVGLVLVSHSEKLAEGVAELAAQLGGDEVPIAAAGGTDDGELGTSIEKIERAIRAADRGAGVLLLADLGSAVLTIKALLDDFADTQASPDTPDTPDANNPPDMSNPTPPSSPRVLLADAPLVEGAVAAVVTAAAGADLATVLASAEEARSYRKL